MFNKTGNVLPRVPVRRETRWPVEVITFLKDYIKENPCFYLEEMREVLRSSFPRVTNVSLSTICRALRFDLKLSRKILSKRARESIPEEKNNYIFRLQPFYECPDQLVFIDETAKDSRDAVRKYAWSRINSAAHVVLPFSRSKRISVLAAMDVYGFFASEMTVGTFDRKAFHHALINSILPYMNPYPWPRSILILDNARIHCYRALVEAVESIGALVFFLPPYSPHLNPIELGFAKLKKWIQKHANISFKEHDFAVLRIALKSCIKEPLFATFEKCGYGQEGLVGELSRQHTVTDLDSDDEFDDADI
jgi:transposase